MLTDPVESFHKPQSAIYRTSRTGVTRLQLRKQQLEAVFADDPLPVRRARLKQANVQRGKYPVLSTSRSFNASRIELLPGIKLQIRRNTTDSRGHIH